jgi:hypothetical protein
MEKVKLSKLIRVSLGKGSTTTVMLKTSGGSAAWIGVVDGHSWSLSTTDLQTLIGLIKEWIEPDTTDCWAAYISITRAGYYHLTVNHSIQFVDNTTGANTNTTESTWKHVKVLKKPVQSKT